jgi:hypothetical protein
MGFGVPMGQWLRGPLRGWAEELLSERRLTDDGFRNRGPNFSPDGRKVLFYSDRAGGYDAWTVDVDGLGSSPVTRSGAAGGASGLLPQPAATANAARTAPADANLRLVVLTFA